ERRLHNSLLAFREAVEKVLPLVRSAAALNDPMPLPEAIGSLFRFLLQTTGAREGVLLVRHYDPERNPAEIYRAYGVEGNELSTDLVPFARSLAGTVISLQEPYATDHLDETSASGSLELHPFERGRQSLLAVPMAVAPGVQVILELFDKQENRGHSFTEVDRTLAAAVAEFGAAILRQALGGQQTQPVPLDGVEAALRASESVANTLRGRAAQRPEEAPPPQVMEKLREGLRASPSSEFDADESLRLIEAVRVLAVRHGPAAVRHCTRLVQSLRDLLDAVTRESEKGDFSPSSKGQSSISDVGEASRE